jgi:hypothetical protein
LLWLLPLQACAEPARSSQAGRPHGCCPQQATRKHQAGLSAAGVAVALKVPPAAPADAASQGSSCSKEGQQLQQARAAVAASQGSRSSKEGQQEQHLHWVGSSPKVRVHDGHGSVQVQHTACVLTGHYRQHRPVLQHGTSYRAECVMAVCGTHVDSQQLLQGSCFARILVRKDTCWFVRIRASIAHKLVCFTGCC